MMRLLAALLALSLLAPAAEAQRVAPLREGDVLRDWRPGSKARLTVTSVTSGTLSLVDASDTPMYVPLVSLSEVSRFVGPRTKRQGAGRGALIGLAAGGAAGLALVVVASRTSNSRYPSVFGPKDNPAHVDGVIIGVIGAGIGALVGSMRPGEKWEEVPLAAMRLQAAPIGGAALQFSFSLR